MLADWVRAGIMAYGSAPDHPAHDVGHWQLQPAMTLRAQLIAVQQLQPGDSVGYGSSFIAEQPMRIGVVACGYADGYPRPVPPARRCWWTACARVPWAAYRWT